MPSHFQRIIFMFDPPSLAKLWLPEARDIACGVDIETARSQKFIDHNSVVDCDPRAMSKLDVGFEADAGDDPTCGQ